MTKLPTSARAVIAGGGIIGCSVAYHLAKLGWKDVILLERAKLTSGSTWHAAGLVGQLRTSANITQLLKYSVELYDRLEAETGQATGWKRNGGLRLACNAERMTEIKRQATTAHSFGLEMHLLTPREARDLWPIMDVSDLVGAAFLPTDGQANPADIAQALAKGARAAGVRIVEDCPVTAFRSNRGRVSGVLTGQGDIACDVVVNCAGQWARELGRLAGVSVPLQSVQHQYLVTEPIPGVQRDLPTLRDPDRLIYFKEEVGGLVMGGYEPNPIPWALNGIPEGFHFALLQSDQDHFEPLMTEALARVPALETAGIKRFINGPESFTPDGNFILGEAPELAGFYVGAGFNAFGIASAGGAGRALAEWIAAGEAPMDLWPVDIRRFGVLHRDRGWVLTRTLEAYGKHYTMAWPHEEYETGRPLRVSPLYERLKAQGACFGSKLGWERPNWFAPAGMAAKDVYSYGRQNWFKAVGAEHRAARERAVIFDQTSFAKFQLLGRDAEAALSWIAANDVAKAPGALVYTQMLNRRGGIECDLTVSRLAEDSYYLVTGTGFATHDFAWIRANIKDGLDARLIDVTSAYAVLSLMGPRAREILAAVTDADMSNAGFPFGSWREIAIAGAVVRALRVTYVGELGWELHLPVETAGAVYDALMAAGQRHGIANAGYRAIESLRLEKGYRAWGSDIGPDHTPIEAGLGWAVKLKQNTPFLGREALAGQIGEPLTKRLACFTVDDPAITLLGRETIFRDGRQVGWLTSAGWGYTVGKNIGFGYVRNPDGVPSDWLKSGKYELEVATERVPAELHLAPLYDPTMARIKA
ncbi:MAG TPA: FAD-dependent oxidoreductase [Candidatus Udaeobacter sp.]|nr:FAD-dependent oxidoreductase [Candidatus Udaeobacter sp.]